jgi:hypothetical protein
MRALSKVQDQQVLGEYVENAKYEDVRTAAIDRITDPEVLLRIVKKRKVRNQLRLAALKRLPDDDSLLDIVASNALEMEFRLQAARRLTTDVAKSKAIRIGDLEMFERKTLLATISDEGTVDGILLDTALPIALRLDAAHRTSNESALLRCIFDSTFSNQERDGIALYLKSSGSCEKALFADGLSEKTQMTLAEKLSDDASRLRIISSDIVATSVRRSMVELISDKGKVLDIVLNANLPEPVREAAADSLRNDEKRLGEAFRNSSDLFGAILGLERLPDPATTSDADQSRLLDWFKKAEQVFHGDASRSMSVIAEKMHAPSSLWYVVGKSAKAPESVRELCLTRISDPNLLVQVACRKGDRLHIREMALDKLKGNVPAIQRVFNDSKDINGAILALERLPSDEIRKASAQRKLANWLNSLSEIGDDLELSVKILVMLQPEAEIDGAEVQMKIARVLATRDSDSLRSVARKLLVDPNSIEALVTEKFGNNQSLAAWAVELVASDAELEKAVYRAHSTFVKCRALSRIENEGVLAKIAQLNNEEEVVRYLALSRLGSGSINLLERFAQGSNVTLAAGAIKALTRIDSKKATAITEEQKKRQQAKKAKRQEFLRMREEQDHAEAQREYAEDKKRFLDDLVPQYANIDILKNIKKCRAWGTLDRQGVYVGDRKVSFIGRISSTETHWFADDEIDIRVDVYGDSYSVHVEIRRLGDLSIGDRIRVTGQFSSGSNSGVTVRNATLQYVH